MINEGRRLGLADDRAALLRALSAYARGVADAPMVCKWGTLAEPVVRQAHHEQESQIHPHPRIKCGAGSDPLPSRERGINAELSGALTFVASTGAVDRHGDTVAPEGWRLDAYRENPVLLWAHDYRRPAIGRAQSVWRDGGALLARLEFAPTEFAREVEGLYRQGYQQGVSVGFRPLRFEERRDARTGAFLGIRFLEQELLEISAVPVPANQGALLARRADVATEVVGLLRGLRG
ncbi:MAG: hypothetical protein F4X64_19220 [Chloroflexi bacterium]|nr:hypothetical protein [Chloroflexota bacterium]